MPTALADDAISRAPKVLLHDHLDGGVRPQTVVEIAGQIGYEALPEKDGEALSRWFHEACSSGSLERYLETFAHTVAVMQTTEGLSRVAREAAEDLADDGVVYAEVRWAPEQHTTDGLSLAVVGHRVRHEHGAKPPVEGHPGREQGLRHAGLHRRLVRAYVDRHQSSLDIEVVQLAAVLAPARHAAALR